MSTADSPTSADRALSGTREWVSAAGYLFVLAPSLLLAASAWADSSPALAFIGLILVAPLLRAFFGDVGDEAPEWSEAASNALAQLPIVAGLAYLTAVASLAAAIAVKGWSGLDLLWLGAGLWTTSSLATCIGHELLHDRNRPLALLVGKLVMGVAGYPLQEQEHIIHHRRVGRVDEAECPAVNESLWRFTSRRTAKVIRQVFELRQLRAAKGTTVQTTVLSTLMVTLGTAALFYWAGGWPAAAMYALAALSVAWSMQAITYLQHWGLDRDTSLATPKGGCYGWEDRCRLQGWLTLNITAHTAHHLRSTVPFYRQVPEADSPKQPAGYIILLFAAMVPPLWFWLMAPSLRRWKESRPDQPTAGHALICLRR